MCYVALSHTRVFVCGISDNLPNIVKCLSSSCSNPESWRYGVERALWSQVSVALQCVLYLLVCREEKAGDAVAELLKVVNGCHCSSSWSLSVLASGEVEERNLCVWRLVLFKEFILVCWC